MEEGNSIIYGLEHQTRALSPQYESDAIRFLIGTQSLKPQSNQVHVVELEEDTGALHTKVFKHDIGEIWHLRCSPHDVATLLTTHNAYNPNTSQCTMGVSIFKLPTVEVIPKDLDDLSAIQGRNAEDMELLITIKPEKPEEEVRWAEWHPTDPSRIGVVYPSGVVVHDVATGGATGGAGGGARANCHAGKWNPHQGHCQFAVLQDTHVKCYDTRTDGAKPAWSIDSAHRQLVRDLDFNPNRQFHLATAGDDAALNIWDYRNGREPIFSRTDHSHWVWTVRYNTYHEQLLLTGSSDARALLTAAAVAADADADATKPACGQSATTRTTSSCAHGRRRRRRRRRRRHQTRVSQLACPAGAASPLRHVPPVAVLTAAAVAADADADADATKPALEDGVLQSYEQHEDSVYACEWSAAEPWTFASLSYDARLVLSRVPRHFKYKILL